MLDNLLIIAVIVIAIWAVALVFYFRTARRQEQIRDELESLRAELEKHEGRSGNE